jgi:hypothetical protein
MCFRSLKVLVIMYWLSLLQPDHYAIVFFLWDVLNCAVGTKSIVK